MVERKATEKKSVKRRVKGYFRKDGKKIKGYTKNINKYPRKYRTFRNVNGSVRFVEVTRIGNKESVKILDTDTRFRATLYLEQPDKFKKSLPFTKFMKKDLDRNEIEAFEKLANSPYEKSYAVDFERYLVHPERYAITKGGTSNTMKIGDFELFGHSHPCDRRSQRLPSAIDLKNMQAFKPEFIITRDQFGPNWNNTELYFFNIEDLQKYDAWKERYKDAGSNEGSITDLVIATEIAKLFAKEKDPKKKEELRKINEDNLFDSEIGRNIFFEKTGVKIYPYDKAMSRVNLELLDDPRPEYAVIPKASTESLKKWQSHLKPYINMEKTKESITQKRKEIDQYFLEKDRTKRSLDDQLKESQYVLNYLGDWQKEGIMSPYVLEEEITKEIEYYKEIARKIEDTYLNDQKERDKWLKNPDVPVAEKELLQKQQTSSLPFSSKDQTVRWLSLSGEQLKKELNDINKYSNLESLKEASESLLSNQEKKLKTRKRLVEIIEKKIAEDRAISHLGR